MKNVHMCYIRVTEGKIENLKKEGKMRISTLVFIYTIHFSYLKVLVRKKIRKRRLFKKVQAFCEEKVLRCLLGVFWYAESKNQCWRAEKWRLHYLICIFPRWPPN